MNLKGEPSMRKVLIIAVFALMLIVMAACGDNSSTPEPSLAQTENNPTNVVRGESQIENLTNEELEIQIDLATDEFLSTFTHLHQALVGTHEHEDRPNLVIWANHPLQDFAVVVLESEWLEDTDEWGFSPRDNFGWVDMLLLGEGYVIVNYMGSGTLPNQGISFFDAELGDTRIFFFQENNAYPEHGGRWMIREIEQDRIVWGFAGGGVDPENEDDYTISINGVPFYGTGRCGFYTIADEQNPTHVAMSVL